MKKMTSAQRVRAAFPEAFSEDMGAVVRIIFVVDSKNAFILGAGPTAKAAWLNALGRIRCSAAKRQGG